jgi:hypothetical protein
MTQSAGGWGKSPPASPLDHHPPAARAEPGVSCSLIRTSSGELGRVATPSLQEGPDNNVPRNYSWVRRQGMVERFSGQSGGRWPGHHRATAAAATRTWFSDSTVARVPSAWRTTHRPWHPAPRLASSPGRRRRGRARHRASCLPWPPAAEPVRLALSGDLRIALDRELALAALTWTQRGRQPSAVRRGDDEPPRRTSRTPVRP